MFETGKTKRHLHRTSHCGSMTLSDQLSSTPCDRVHPIGTSIYMLLVNINRYDVYMSSRIDWVNSLEYIVSRLYNFKVIYIQMKENISMCFY